MMKKKLLFISLPALIALAAINVNLAFNNDSIIHLSLTSIEALAFIVLFVANKLMPVVVVLLLHATKATVTERSATLTHLIWLAHVILPVIHSIYVHYNI